MKTPRIDEAKEDESLRDMKATIWIAIAIALIVTVLIVGFGALARFGQTSDPTTSPAAPISN